MCVNNLLKRNGREPQGDMNVIDLKVNMVRSALAFSARHRTHNHKAWLSLSRQLNRWHSQTSVKLAAVLAACRCIRLRLSSLPCARSMYVCDGVSVSVMNDDVMAC